jgi:hypothetical protein
VFRAWGLVFQLKGFEMSQVFGVSGYGRKPRVNLDDDLPADKAGTGLDNGANADAALADLRTANGLPAQAPRFNNATSKGANGDAALADLRTSNGLPAQGPRFDNATSKGFEESKQQMESRKRIVLEGKGQYDTWLGTAEGREAQDAREVGKQIRMGVSGPAAWAKVQADWRQIEATAFEREQVRRDQDRKDWLMAGREGHAPPRQPGAMSSAITAAANAIGAVNQARKAASGAESAMDSAREVGRAISEPISQVGEGFKGIGRTIGFGQGGEKPGPVVLHKGKDRRTGQVVFYLEDGRIVDENGRVVKK